MNTKNLLSISSSLLLLSSCSAQVKNVRSTTLRINGDCPMCEKPLEKPIKDPFYGSMILTCCTVKQTIP